MGQQNQFGPNGTYLSRNRYFPYQNRPLVCPTQSLELQCQQPLVPIYSNCSPLISTLDRVDPPYPTAALSYGSTDKSQSVTLQINNLDYSMDEARLRHFLLNQLKPITPVLSLVFEGNSYAKLTVPDMNCAKQVVANLHRKKVGHKRMVVSYTRDSSLTEINTLRCQVAGLLKDVPYCTLPMYKFRELFQSRFKTSISVLDLYKMHDICGIMTDKNDEKYISLHPELASSIESSPLMEFLQHSVPYCTIHFKREQHKGWAEQDIEPLPNVFMTISEIQQIIYPLLKRHPGDIPVASLVHCVSGELGTQIVRNENGVNLEHLICCVQGIQITTNNFGIKILGWLEPETAVKKESSENRFLAKSGLVAYPLYQISREVIELIKMSPKSTMKFDRFIPAYHTHFGKQCRVADYGYTKLIELFEALSTVVQIMGDGENRQITLTHRTQIRRFTSDLLRVLRSQGNKSVLLSQLPTIFSQTQNRHFDITDYGVCDIVDILDGLVNSNIVVVSTIPNGKNGNDVLISIPKRKQTSAEIEKTSVFAGEVVELFRNAPQYSILFQKFVRSYHYHFGYQCRLSDYGFLKLADLMEAIQGVVEIEYTTDEDKKVYLSPKVARRVFAEQMEELVREFTGCPKTCMKLNEVLQLHKKKFGYQIQPQTLGAENILDVVRDLPYIEFLETDNIHWIICHFEDFEFRRRCYKAWNIFNDMGKKSVSMNDFVNAFADKYDELLMEHTIISMKHLIQIKQNDDDNEKYVTTTRLANFLMTIIKALEPHYMTEAEIKTTLGLEISDCFEFGYANLHSLLRAYQDIFVVEAGTSHDKSYVGLVEQGEFGGNVRYKLPRPQQVNTSKTEKKQQIVQSVTENQPQPLLMYNNLNNNKNSNNNSRGSSKLPRFTESKSIPSNGCSKQNLLATYNTMPLANQPTYNKENYNSNIFNGSLNSSATSDHNSSCGSLNNISGHAGGMRLFDRRKVNPFRDINDMFDIISSAPAQPSYGPPKPDTPPSDSVPFWIDPIWANGNGEKTPTIDSLNINLPEMKSLNILPMLMSPYSMSKTENMKQMFSFDGFDRKIS